MARLCVCLLALAMLASVKGATREYFIAAQDILWNYVPGGGQFKDRDGETFAETWTKQNADRIGPVYRKAAYFQYTDASFSEEIPKHPQLGLLGPLIRAEVGDVIVINFFNNATGNFSIHPHAVFYQKMNEGALYLDGTSGQDKKDDAVPPGKIVTQIWHVTENNSPTDSDPNCLPWVYHSHTDAVKDPAAGLLGVIVTCKKGVLDSYGVRKDVDVDLPLVAFNWDENLSWYIDENIQRYCGDPARCVQLQQSADPAFVDSNRRRSLNGLQFSTMFGLQACAGSRVVFYNIGFGNEVDVHGIHFHGQDMKYQHTRGDTVSVYSATFVAAETTPQVPGDWLVTDVTENNERAGISAIFSVFDCDAAGYKKSETYGIVRRYFLTVEETTWNYAPSGKDLRTGQDLTGPSASSSYMESDKGHSFYQYESPNYQAPSQSQYPGPSQIQLTYTKARFFQYTNGAFKYRVASPEHLGLVGPVLKAEVGDTLVVSLKNTIPFPVSFLPHGLRYDSSEEFIAGTSYPGGIVGQGEVHNYTFYVPTDLLDGSYLPCRNFLYSSTYDIAKDQNAGLVGVLLVCRKGYFSSKEYKPKQIFLLLSIIDESNSLYTKPNTSVPDLKAAINGYIFGNLPQLDVCTNENVIWYVMSVGSALDVHTLTFDGNTFDENGNNRDARYLTPGDTAALSMNPDNPGRWMLYSHSNLARENGMFAFYNVKTCTSSYTSKDQSGYTSKDQLGYTSKDQSGYTSKDQSGYGKTRDYFVAADELLWDYAPLPRSIVTGEDLFNPNTEGHIFVRQDPYFIGKVHKKAVYREYTDDSFKLIKPGENRDILGPVMVAEVGDTIKITFKNNARIPFSIHAHGLKTSQKDSGVNYGDAAAVAPGQVYQYVWQVPERSGPGRNDPNCIPWVYYSSIDPLKDTNSGLIGGLVVCRKGILDSYSRRKDVDRELFTLFTVMNENDSWYLEENIKMFAPARLGTNYQNDPRFVESNKKHTINGRIYGNNQNLIMIYNQKVAWNVMGLGTEIDLHTVHFHGHTYVQRSIDHKDDVVQIFPGMAEVVEFVADDPGTWLFHCHVLDHIAAGMETYYTVFKPAAAQDSKAY